MHKNANRLLKCHAIHAGRLSLTPTGKRTSGFVPANRAAVTPYFFFLSTISGKKQRQFGLAKTLAAHHPQFASMR